MTQDERRAFLIRRLMDERPEYRDGTIPAGPAAQRRALRALMNVRPPAPIDGDVLAVQDEYLRQELAAKGVTDIEDLTPLEPGIYLWQGDITALRCDAIVNAANSGMTGCYVPGHNCIDNCIHTYAGMQLRLACAQLMARQGHEERTGTAKLTPAFNLPCRYVIHTVGPIVEGPLTAEHVRLLESCYRACLDLAAETELRSVAFCCISTGVFHFPKDKAARVATDTVRAWRAEYDGAMEVIFNVHSRENYDLYRALLG